MATERLDTEAQWAERIARLEHEVAEARRRESEALQREAEGLARETATGEILRVISSSPTETQPVFQAILANAARLCSATIAALFLFDGESLAAVAHQNASPEFAEFLQRSRPRPSRETTTRRCALERRTIHVADLLNDPEYSPPEFQRRENVRTVVSVPLLREGLLVGVITLWRREVRPFRDKQVELLETFADQAVIAIENARLFGDLKEALEQQTATGEILRVIATSPAHLQPVLDAVAAYAARLCDTDDSVILRAEGDALRPIAHYGDLGPEPVPLSRGLVAGRAVLDRRTIHVGDLAALAETEYPDSPGLRQGTRTVLVTPLLREGAALGAILIRRREVRPFNDVQIKLLETFADQAVIAIENARLFQDLSEALRRQTATSDILRVIAGSPTDLQAVLDAMAESAARVCEADNTVIYRLEGDRVRAVAFHVNVGDRARYEQDRDTPRPLNRRTVTGRAIVDRETVHVRDFEAAVEDEFPDSKQYFQALGHRTVVNVPLLQRGVPLGAIAVVRMERRPFTEQQIELVRTFADQAVIAIENARLFTGLSEALERQTATAEILRVISGSPTDLQPVLDAVAENAARVCGADDAIILRIEGDEFRRVAEHGPIPKNRGATPFATPGDRATVAGRAVMDRRTIQVPDALEADAEYPETGARAKRLGFRTLLATPLLREGVPLGVILIRRSEVRPFSDQQIRLLETFADQAVIAIENVTLFHEIQEKSRQLEEVSRHKSEFLANMSHELRTPLNAIIGFSEVLLERLFGDVNEKQAEYLQDILTSGQHLLSLINDILDLSKVEAGRMELELGEFSLREALENGLTMLKERAGRHGITLGLDVEDGLDLIEADERKVKQVLFNLLSNAVKFTPDGGSVRVSAGIVDGQVEVAVRDTGIGIAPEDLSHVFDEFRQVGQDAAGVEGTGLGLALTKKLVELHGGRIWVESAVGAGSTFAFVLPRLVAAPRT
jgi:signal transduction histidine kinase/putative methionine-R-sulfoxide reductase with GAF domain